MLVIARPPIQHAWHQIVCTLFALSVPSHQHTAAQLLSRSQSLFTQSLQTMGSTYYLICTTVCTPFPLVLGPKKASFPWFILEKPFDASLTVSGIIIA